MPALSWQSLNEIYQYNFDLQNISKIGLWYGINVKYIGLSLIN